MRGWRVLKFANHAFAMMAGCENLTGCTERVLTPNTAACLVSCEWAVVLLSHGKLRGMIAPCVDTCCHIETVGQSWLCYSHLCMHGMLFAPGARGLGCRTCPAQDYCVYSQIQHSAVAAARQSIIMACVAYDQAFGGAACQTFVANSLPVA
jgi:hypothetical protein